MNQSPSITIQDIHFKAGFTVLETANLGTGRTQLDISSAPDLTSYSTTTQTAALLAAKQDDLSAIRTTNAITFERDITITQPHYYPPNYPNLKLSVPGGDLKLMCQSNLNCSLAIPGQYFGITTNANAGTPLLCNGINVSVAGTFSAPVKNFLIDDPRPGVIPSSPNMIPKLRHWCVEGDTPAGLLMYRRQVNALSTGHHIIEMPSWFEHLAGDVKCFSSPGGRHFGLSWAEQDPDNLNKIIVGCSKPGMYNVLITATRQDHCALHVCEREVLFEEARINNPDKE